MNTNIAPPRLRRRNAYNQPTDNSGNPINENDDIAPPRLRRRNAYNQPTDNIGNPINENDDIAPPRLRRRNAYNQPTDNKGNPISGGGLVNPDNSHNPALLSSNQGAVVGYIGSSNKVDGAMGKGVHYKTMKGGKRKPKKKTGKKKHGKTAKRKLSKKNGKKQKKVRIRRVKKNNKKANLNGGGGGPTILDIVPLDILKVFFNAVIKAEIDKVIIPAIKKLRLKNNKINGPFPADTIFTKFLLKKYDVIIGMYHDQVLSPMKALFGFDAINITLGLPFTRISPDHGPNYSMLGKNLSDPKSLIQALKFLDK